MHDPSLTADSDSDSETVIISKALAVRIFRLLRWGQDHPGPHHLGGKYEEAIYLSDQLDQALCGTPKR